MATKLKRGRISKSEQEYIRANHDTMTVEAIASHLRRSEDFVRQQIAALPTVEQNIEQGDWVSRLHASSFWPEIRKGLMGSEVGYFEKAWASYMDQFGSATDILATDELMIKDLVMLDIFSQRAITEQANTLRRIDELEKAIEKEENLDEEDRNQMQLANWRTQVNSLYAAKTAISKQHLDYQQRKDAKLRDLKGSRDQRFKQIEESRRNIFELIKELDKRKRRVEEGRLAEKVKIAAERVRQDWNELHEFEDGEVDKPFLSPEGELEDARLQNGQDEANRQED
jgi:soluble cytochrome b562